MTARNPGDPAVEREFKRSASGAERRATSTPFSHETNPSSLLDGDIRGGWRSSGWSTANAYRPKQEPFPTWRRPSVPKGRHSPPGGLVAGMPPVPEIQSSHRIQAPFQVVPKASSVGDMDPTGASGGESPRVRTPRCQKRHLHIGGRTALRIRR